jgi:hypothetical protein
MCPFISFLELIKSIAPILAAIIAVCGVAYAAHISLFQVRKNNVISARIKWLQDLKENVSNFITDCYSIIQFKKDAQAKRINLNKNYLLIRLNLNSSEQLSIKLIEQLDLIMSEIDKFIEATTLHDENIIAAQINNLCQKVTNITGSILKIEWEVTKSGDINFRSKAERSNFINDELNKLK